MIRSLPKMLWPASFCALLLTTEISSACEFHGDYGFGGPGIKSYRDWAAQNAPTAKADNWINLQTPSIVKGESGGEIELNIGYEKIPSIGELELSFKSFPKLDNLPDAIKVTSPRGTEKAIFSAKKAGIYKIDINAKAMEDGVIKSKHTQVYLRVIDTSGNKQS